MIKKTHFSPQLYPNSSLVSSIRYDHLETLEIQQLDLNFHKSSSSKKNNQNSKSNIKIKPSTDRTIRADSQRNSSGNIADFIQNLGQSRHLQKPNNKTDRQTLIQKQKSYAETIRFKNKILLQQNNQQSQKQIVDESLTQSFSRLMESTPPKDTSFKDSQPSSVKDEYYSLKKPGENSIVFRQSNSNKQNSIGFSSIEMVKNQKSTVTSKINGIMNKSIELNESGCLSKRFVNDKQNSIFLAVKPSLSNRKQAASKSGSYAQIFDKKSTINALLSHQRVPGSANRVTRRINSKIKEKQSLISMEVSEFQQQFQCGHHQISKNKQNPDTYINGFAIEFAQTIEQISQICQLGEQFSKTEQVNAQNQCHKLSLNSNIYYLSLPCLEQIQRRRFEEEKQIIIMTKQNGTFKKQLAAFRRQNSGLRKQLENGKKYIKQLEERANKLIQEQECSVSNILAQHSIKHSQYSMNTAMNTCAQPQPINSQKIFRPQSNLQQILQSSQHELFSLKSCNKTLELKVYMLEKRLNQQLEFSKKRMALQVKSWKQKYNKLRNEHLKMKNSIFTPFMNSDWSLSMNISKDQ